MSNQVAPKVRTNKKYGWVPDIPDKRDFKFCAIPSPDGKPLPPSIDLTPGFTPAYNQAELGSCTTNAIGGNYEYEEIKQGKPNVFMPSRLFIYFNERLMEGTVASDSGAMIRDGIKSVATQGVCSEDMWPYEITAFTNKPSDECYTAALNNKVVQYLRVNRNIHDMKSCLADGYPFVFGFSVYQSFESGEVAQTGLMPMPLPNETLLGGHAVCAVGYDDATERIKVRNSWGTEWGVNGYFFMPYKYITDNDLADDFWTIRLIQQ